MDNAGNHLICIMVGYKTILETVYVIKTIQDSFLIFAYLVCFCILLSEDIPNDV